MHAPARRRLEHLRHLDENVAWLAIREEIDRQIKTHSDLVLQGGPNDERHRGAREALLAVGAFLVNYDANARTELGREHADGK